MSARRSLRLLLCELFDAGDFRVFVRDWYPDVTAQLPEGAIEPSELFARAIEVLERHQAIDEAFFARLRQERESRASEIEAVRVAWEREVQEGGLASDPGDLPPAEPGPRTGRWRWIVLGVGLVALGAAGATTWALWPRCPKLEGHIEGVGACEAFVAVTGQGRAPVQPDGSFAMQLQCPLPDVLKLELEVTSFEGTLVRAVPRDEVGHVELRLTPACGGTNAIRGRVSFVGAGPVAGARIDRIGCEASGSSNDHGVFHLGGLSTACASPPIQLRVLPPVEEQAHRITFDRDGVASLGRPPFFEIELPREDAFPEREAPVRLEEVGGESTQVARRAALGTDVPARIVPALASIGRIEAIGRTPHLGTGFIVAARLVMTTRTVAEGLGATEDGAPIGNAQFVLPEGAIPITRARVLHRFWNIAVLELERAPSARPLDLVAARPDPFEGRELALVGYPTADPARPEREVRNVFGTELGVQRVQLGVLAGVGDVDGHEAIVHDVFTLAGQPGAPLLDLESGEVIGVHFAWSTERGSFAVPAWELYADRSLRSMPMQFRARNRSAPVLEDEPIAMPAPEAPPSEPSSEPPRTDVPAPRSPRDFLDTIGPRLEPMRRDPPDPREQAPEP